MAKAPTNYLFVSISTVLDENNFLFAIILFSKRRDKHCQIEARGV